MTYLLAAATVLLLIGIWRTRHQHWYGREMPLNGWLNASAFLFAVAIVVTVARHLPTH